ncbi:MFS transporter [Orenia marismortui]|uniref:MFS transporter n=1 Tax=Orenia marismortui TaxID=46469 RepID=UPI00035EFC7F|nr:MFS transporter [Orenia marismortui]
MKKIKNHKILVVLTFSIMLVFGIIVNLKGQINPLIQEDYGINNTKLGLVLTLFSIGGIMVSLFSGELIKKFNLKKFFLGGALIAIISLITLSYINNYYLLMIIMGFMGIGISAINVVANSLASRVFVKNRGRMMNLFHLFFGVGGYLAPLYANRVFSLGFEWEATYSFSIIFIFYIILFATFCKFPKEERGLEQEDKQREVNVWNILKDTRVIIFVLMFLINVGVEIGSVSWLGVYLDTVQERSKVEIGFYISLYFGLFTLGRFLASFIVEKLGYLKMVLICVLGSAISIFLGVVGPNYFVFFLSLTGFFAAANFPTIQAAMFETFEDNISVIIGLTLAAGELGNIFLANLLIGFINDLLGVKIGYSIMIFYLLLLAGLVFYLKTVHTDKKVTRVN